ncbi:MAG: metallophosphoesterase, partial [Pseudomonadota bacterium]
ELMAGFRTFVREMGAELVLDLGDRISDVDHETDRTLARDVAEAFAEMDVPIHHVCGNHDRDHLSVAENEEILGQDLQHGRIDLADWRLLLWRADAKIWRGPDLVGFDLPEADLLWLASELQKTDRPTLVVSHVPVSGHSQIGNYYFERNAQFATYPQVARVRAVLNQCWQPVVCIAGHVHWNTATQVDGIMHLTQQSLTESFTTKGEPAGAWGLLDLDHQIRWQVFGRDRLDLRFQPQPHRWVPPIGPF